MKYKYWLINAMVGLASGAIILSIISYIIDPIGQWESPIIAGLNNNKKSQREFLDVFKPFQVVNHEADMIYIGSSRIFVGFRTEEYAYNMAASSLSLADMKEYLHLVYSHHIPQKIYIGLDLFQFSASSLSQQRAGFSHERNQIVQNGGLSLFSEKLKTNLGMIKYVPNTVYESICHKEKEPPFIRGYYQEVGEANELIPKEYYYSLHDYYTIYTKSDYGENAPIDCLADILQEASEHDVEIVLFFNPISIDLQALQDICGRQEAFADIKRKVAALHPVYDFAWVSPLTMDRKNSWSDGSHYFGRVGDRLKMTMNYTPEDESFDSAICRYLVSSTIENHLLEERDLYDRWRVDNEDYIHTLSYVSSNQIPDKALYEFIGF